MIWFALSANFKVFIVYSKFFEEGDILPIINVLVFIVKDYWSNRVNFDSLNAATLDFLVLDKELITFPKVVKDKLMFFNYSKWSFTINYFLLIFSLPAKSHKLSLDFI